MREDVISPSKSYEDRNNFDCWEDRIRNQTFYEVFILDSMESDDNRGDYSCDSIYAYNKILRHYKFNVEEMQARDFIINYPEDEGIEPKD